MKIALIDDEPYVLETTKTVLEHYFKDLEIYTAESVAQGVELLKSYRLDLVFLDVTMRDGTGFDLLTRVPKLNFRVVFVTAHSDYAIKAFKFSALDYILKPVNPEEILNAVNKARVELDGQSEKLNLLDDYWKKGFSNKIVLTDLKGMNVVDLRNIIRCQAVGNYTHFFLKGGQQLIISTTLKHYDEILSDQGFFRVHQSHLINMEHLTKFSKNDGGEVLMKDSTSVPVSLRRKEALKELLKRFKC